MRTTYCLLILWLIAGGQLAGCGQKGPLQMPEPAPQAQEAERR